MLIEGVLDLGRAGQHAQDAVEGAHLTQLLELLTHVFKGELALHHLLGELLGVFLLDHLGGLFDQADHVAHAED